MNMLLFLSQAALLVSLFLISSSTVVHATVFAWKGEGGALHFSNDPEGVPEAHRTSARQFTSKLAGKAAPELPFLLLPHLHWQNQRVRMSVGLNAGSWQQSDKWR